MACILNNKTFKTKEKLSNYISYILNNAKINSLLEGEYKEDIIILINYHPEASNKIGAGIKEIRVERHTDKVTNKYPHFHIYRVDGTNEDFSYKKCIRNIGTPTRRNRIPGNLIDIKNAARYEVRDFVYEFKLKAFGIKRYLKCPILNINTSRKTCHVDHISPLTFDQLLFNFINKYNIDMNEIKVKNKDGIIRELEDRDLAEMWINYHNTNAQLRVLHKAANLAQKKAKVAWDYKAA